jgi:hypothetical protein
MDLKAVEHEFLGSRVVCFNYKPWTFAGWARKVDAGRMIRRAYHDLLSRLSD